MSTWYDPTSWDWSGFSDSVSNFAESAFDTFVYDSGSNKSWLGDGVGSIWQDGYDALFGADDSMDFDTSFQKQLDQIGGPTGYSLLGEEGRQDLLGRALKGSGQESLDAVNLNQNKGGGILSGVLNDYSDSARDFIREKGFETTLRGAAGYLQQKREDKKWEDAKEHELQQAMLSKNGYIKRGGFAQ